jgi:ribosomal protein L37AE/L43A
MTPPVTTVTAPEPAALFDLTPAPAEPVSGVPAGRFGPAAYDTALTGDDYGWLADLLGSPQPPSCERCGQPMTLPAAAPVLWACPACHPGEAA